MPALKVNRLLLRNGSAVGVLWVGFLDIDPTLMANSGERLNGMLAAGNSDPQIGAPCRFEDLPEGLDQQTRGEIPGKAIVELADSEGGPSA